MKNLLLVLLFTFALASPSRASNYDLGLLLGWTSNYSSAGSGYGTLGATGAFYLGSLSAGLKMTTMNGPSLVQSGLTYSTNQFNIMGQLKYNLSGFFAGVNLGLGTTSVGTSVGGYGISVGQGSFIYGPTIGYYFGKAFRFGVEFDYTLCSAAGWVNTITSMVGVKYTFPSSEAVETTNKPAEATPTPQDTKDLPVIGQ